MHCLLALSAPVVAQEHTTTSQTEPPATRTKVDEQAKVIHFFVDGEQAMRLDANGMYVREGINYGGSLSDYGRIGFDANVYELSEGDDAQ